jgi:hypothetical protein
MLIMLSRLLLPQENTIQGRLAFQRADCKITLQRLHGAVSVSWPRPSDTHTPPFAEWTEVFGDPRLTSALLDRLTHHCHILEFAGESYRFRQSLQQQTDSSELSKS